MLIAQLPQRERRRAHDHRKVVADIVRHRAGRRPDRRRRIRVSALPGRRNGRFVRVLLLGGQSVYRGQRHEIITPVVLMLLRWMLVAAIAAALLAFVRSRRWLTFPIFTLYLLIAGIAAATHVRMEQWPGASWIRWQYILVGLRVLCAVEILFRLTTDDRDRWTLRICSILLPAAVVFTVWRVADVLAVPRLARAIGHVEAGIIGMLLLALLLPFSFTPAHRKHAWLFLLLMINQLWQLLVWESRALNLEQWQRVNAAYTAVAILCAVGWALITSHAPDAESATLTRAA
jgi:hypothetical protein